VAGALISHTNVKWGMLVYVCMCVPNVAAAWLVTAPSKPTESQSNEGGSAKEDAGGAAADKLAAKAGAKEETGDASAAKVCAAQLNPPTTCKIRGSCGTL
jgi:hypothetical protein